MAGSVVVLSGGLDSTTCLALATRDASPPVALTFDYGQTHRTEVDRAAAVARHYGAEHVVVTLDASAWAASALTDPTDRIPDAADVATHEIPATYVPARNLVFLSVAMGVAEVRAADAVYIGVNALDYSGYPDCRPEFVESFAATAALALKRGVEGNPVELRMPLVDCSKADIVRLAVRLDVPLQLTWSCYRGGDTPCGRCDSCHLRAKGFAEAGIPDPTRPT